ncbi:interleukin-1 receptor-associated kinase 1 isoform X3 [Paralichthys olivaceus]|uniref:interleukin-1 receptor-associated kinase 1 isoform X3 n=1 Tax=Paralichthys olivaceus TaxID=8255 RepID=UPI003753D629
MSGGDPRGQFLYKLPPKVLWDFCRVMDGLSDLDWTNFASEVLCDQTEVRLAERNERRTDWVMNQWSNRNGRVGELIDLLERLQLFRPQDVILSWTSVLKPVSPPPPPPEFSSSQFDPPPKPSVAPSTESTRRLTEDKGGGRPLPRPAPPPSNLRSECHSSHPEATPVVVCGSGGGVMCWSYDEVHARTHGFSTSLQVGEGGFGVVYRATLGNTDCAVKRLKQDCVLDLTFLKQTFQTEVEKLSKFRHPNIVDLLGVCEGGGSLCLIYSYMDNRSLEEQLHNCDVLTWCQRLSIVKDVSSALAFLHSPPDRHAPLIHGDVKSSNILLDRHLVAKLADFGLARFGSSKSTRSPATRTVSVGKTETVRGTLAYLPDEYVRKGELGTEVDVYSFGVVLLEVLTGRRALERDGKSGERYLKDLVEEVEDSLTGSCAAMWKKQLDQRLTTGGAAEPAEWMTVLALACICLEKNRKKRPAISEVFEKLKDVHNLVTGTNSSSSSLHHPLPPHPHYSSPSLPRPSMSINSRVEALSKKISKLGPLEDPARPTQPSSSCVGPCETDESQGFSQFRSDRTSSTSLSTRDQHHCGPSEFTSVPTEDQYNFPPQPSCSNNKPGAWALTGPDDQGQNSARLYGVPEYLSPAGSLQSQSSSLGPSGQNEQKRTELLSSDDLYGEGGAAGSRRPEESDELDYLPAKHD